MEFTSSQIAKLVLDNYLRDAATDTSFVILGYLKSEKCDRAFNDFLDGSVHLKPFSNTIKNSKYYVTRVGGYNLVDYLTEYAIIYTIIQERLEATEYFSDKRSKNLVDQLVFLLDNGRQTRCNTPIRSRSSTPLKQKFIDSEAANCINNLSVIHESNISPDINATALQNLPGNVSNDSFNTTPKRKVVLSPTKSHRTVRMEGGSDSTGSPDKSKEDDDLSVEVLTQTLLDNHELHEKIAENINLVRSSSDTSAGMSILLEGVSSGALKELDTAIKTIVQRTEADPIFDKLVTELIGTVSESTDEEHVEVVINNNLVLDTPEKSTHQEETGLMTPEKCIEVEQRTLKHRLRSSKKQYFQNSNVEEHVNEAVHSIVAAASQTNINQTDSTNAQKYDTVSSTTNIKQAENAVETKVDVHQNLSVNTNTSDIIVYDGSLENYIKSSVPVAPQLNPFILNSSLLMIQPSTSVATPVEPVKPYLIWNGSQFVNVSVPQIKINNITEQDILTMPTVFVGDDQQAVTAQNVTPYKNQPSLKKHLNIVPKPVQEVAQNITEFLTLYQCNDINESMSESPASKLQSQNKPKMKKVSMTSQSPVSHMDMFQSTTGTVPIVQTREASQPAKKQSHTSRKESKSSDRAFASKTPETKCRNPRARSLSTPKSGSMSHVRALDFNLHTPGKIAVLGRKANTSPKSVRIAEKRSLSKSSAKISKSLFATPTKVSKPQIKLEAAEQPSTPELKKNVKAVTSWDSDLRALMGPISDRCPTPKKKRKSNLRSKKVASNSTPDMNQTEIDAKAIEEILVSATPGESSANKSKTSEPSNPRIRRRRIGAKHIISPRKIVRRGKVTNVKTPKQKVEDTDVTVDSIEIVSDTDSQKEDATDGSPVVTETTFTLINCNRQPRFKRKCNIDNSVKKEVKVTKVKEIKSLEFVTDGNNKLVLSPSKLNANKRSLVEIDDKSVKCKENPDNNENKTATIEKEAVIQVEIVENVTSEQGEKDGVNKTLKAEADSINAKTPEMLNEPTVQHPLAANRNIIPFLETPMKMDFPTYPKTPGIFSPINANDTPFTKVFKEQMHGVDISAINTPNLPLTPSFELTPRESEMYPRRGTDYSTSSSYYQPSDTEQNKSLELLIIEECKRLETKKETPAKSDSQAGNDNRARQNDISAKTELTQKKVEEPNRVVSDEQHLVHQAIAEKMKLLSQNVIGRKNLNLVKPTFINDDSLTCESSSLEAEDTSVSSNGDDIDSDDEWNATNNKTVVAKKLNNSNTEARYPLRSRKVEVKQANDEVNGNEKHEQIAAIQEIITRTEVKTTLEPPKSLALNYQEIVLQELDKKRKRVIAKFKVDNEASKSKEPVKKTCPAVKKMIGKVKTIPAKPKTPAVNRKLSRRKSNSPKKIMATNFTAKETTVAGIKVDVTSKNSEIKLTKIAEDIQLHISSDSEYNIEPFDIVETQLLDSSTSTPCPTNTTNEAHPLHSFHRVMETIKCNQAEKQKENNSDQEAEILVRGLKERGIHLIPNKTPRKQIGDPLNTLNKQKSICREDVKRNILKMQNLVSKVPDKVLPVTSGGKDVKVISELSNNKGEEGTKEVNNSDRKLPKISVPDCSNKEINPINDSVNNRYEKSLTSIAAQPDADQSLVPSKCDIVLQNSGKSSSTVINLSLEEGEIVSDHEMNRKSNAKISTEKSLHYKPLQKNRAYKSSSGRSFKADSHSPRFKPRDYKRLRMNKKRAETHRKKEYRARDESTNRREKSTCNIKEYQSRVVGCMTRKKPTSKRDSLETLTKSAGPSKIKTLCTTKKRTTSKQKDLFEEQLTKNDIPNRVELSKSNEKHAKKNDGAEIKSKESSIKNKECVIKNDSAKAETISDELLKDLNLTDSFTELDFDSKTYTEPDLTLVHDDNTKPNSAILNYDPVKLSNRKLSAKVYVEAIDAELEKVMTITKFQDLLNIPEGFFYKSREAADKVKILECITIPSNRVKPLDLLYDKLTKNTVITTTSPLDDLYLPLESNRYKSNKLQQKPTSAKELANSSSLRRRFSVDVTRTKRRSTSRETHRSKSLDQKPKELSEMLVCKRKHTPALNSIVEKLESKLKSTAEKAKYDEKVKVKQKNKFDVEQKKNLSKDSSTKKTEGAKKNTDTPESLCSPREDITKKTDLSEGSSTSIGDSQNDAKTKSDLKITNSKTDLLPTNKPDNELKVSDTGEQEKLKEKDMDVVDGVIMLNSNEKAVDTLTDDGLMDYAICGSDRTEDSDGVLNTDKTSSSKRRASETSESLHKTKKSKTDSCQELLKTIDVDSFLKKVHGEA